MTHKWTIKHMENGVFLVCCFECAKEDGLFDNEQLADLRARELNALAFRKRTDTIAAIAYPLYGLNRRMRKSKHARSSLPT